jgi:hypothetical protein
MLSRSVISNGVAPMVITPVQQYEVADV